MRLIVLLCVTLNGCTILNIPRMDSKPNDETVYGQTYEDPNNELVYGIPREKR